MWYTFLNRKNSESLWFYWYCLRNEGFQIFGCKFGEWILFVPFLGTVAHWTRVCSFNIIRTHSGTVLWNFFFPLILLIWFLSNLVDLMAPYKSFKISDWQLDYLCEGDKNVQINYHECTINLKLMYFHTCQPHWLSRSLLVR